MSGTTNSAVWRFANAELDPRARELRVAGKPVSIEPKPFDVLALLLEHAGELLTIEEMLESAWTGRIVNEATITNTIFKIRKALGDEDQSIIKTIPKAGYRLVCPVERGADEGGTKPLAEMVAGGDVPGRDQWQLVEHLGGGGYGDAWLAVQKKTGERRVFKFCLDNERLPAFKREVTLYRLLSQSLPDHEGIARILEWNFDQAPYYIESEYAGVNLRRWAESRNGLATIPLDERIDVVVRIAAAVAAAHSVGVLHKDLKPENVLITESPEGMSVRLCDFGVGRLLDVDRLGELGITRLGFTRTVSTDPSTSGTLIYMAPELLSSGMPSVQSDIYALGVLLYQMVIGKFGEPMAHGWEAAIIDDVLRQDIADATHGDRNRRIASAQILADRLIHLAERRTQLAQQLEAQRQTERSRVALARARALRPWLAAAAVILVAAAAWSFYMAAKDHAQARQAQAFSDFIADDIIKGFDTYSADTPEASMRDAIVKALPLVKERFAGKPLVEASMDSALAQALRRTGDYDDALMLDQRAVSLYGRKLGDDDVRLASSQIEVAADLHYLNRDPEAKALIDAHLPALQTALPPTDPHLIFARQLQASLACAGKPNCP